MGSAPILFKIGEGATKSPLRELGQKASEGATSELQKKRRFLVCVTG